MTEYFVTSDTHFGHKNILKYNSKSRPFDTVEEMNERLIQNWNSVVSDDDVVIHLGDFFMGKTDIIKPILDRLNFKAIYLILGNHDQKNRQKVFKEYDNIYLTNRLFFDYSPYVKFVMNHYPMDYDWQGKKPAGGWNEACSWFNQFRSSAVYLYGHTHQYNAMYPNWRECNTYNVGADANALTPVKLDTIANYALDPELPYKRGLI